MSDDIQHYIDSEAFLSKSKVYIRRALNRKGDKDLDEYQLWASLALELLGKAALARKHPCLVVDPTHWKSMFVAAGINITTDVKTIPAKTLFERLRHLIQPWFDSTVQGFCNDITMRRNAELHSAGLPFRTMNLDAWEGRYWHACDTILQHMESSLNQWLAPHAAKAPQRMVVETAKAMIEAVGRRIEQAKQAFELLDKKEREQLATEVALQDPEDLVDPFNGGFDKTWAVECPACGCQASMSGDQTGEDITENYGEEDGVWETVDREFTGERFLCPVCRLTLTGIAEINAAALPYTHEDQIEREPEYEPDYGND